MAGIIIDSGLESASNTDILQGGRLQTVPRRGTMLFLLAASDNNATNNFTVSIQLPDGRTPMNGVRVPQGQDTAGTVGILRDGFLLAYEAIINQGGHTVFSCTETGDTELFWRIIYTPRR